MAENKEKREVEIIINGQRANASLKELDAAAALMYNQLRKMSADDPGREKLKNDFQELKGRIGDVREELKGASESSSFLQKAMVFSGVQIGVETIVDGIKDLGAEVINTTKEVAELRGNINSLTGATGQELDELTTSVLAVSRTFGKEFNEVLQAGNALSKQMGISQQEAMRLIEQGFAAGADAGGDFLDQVKEYAPQFKAAGLSATQFIGQISQSVTTGVFSDKGADVVKEFGLRIREQTTSTRDAMQAAFGPEFTKSIFDGINNGSLTSAEALQRVAKEIDETKIPAAQLQTVIADVFGGPGEDAGVEYIKSLKNVGKGIDELVDSTNVYVQRQQAQLASEKELAAAQNDLAKSFEGGSTVMQTMTNQAMTVLYTLLVSLGATFRELAEPVQQVWGQLRLLAEQMGWVSKEGTTAKGVGEALGAVIRFIFTPTKLLWGVIADLVTATVAWAKSSDTARGYLRLLAAPVEALFDLLRNGPAYFAGFSAAAESSFGTIGRAWQRIKDRDFRGAADEFKNIGKKAGDAYTSAFNDALAKKAATSAIVAAGGEHEAEAGPTRAAGGDGLSAADAAKADKAREAALKRAQAAADKAAKARQDNIKEWVRQEELLEDARILAMSNKRDREVAKINLDARRKAAVLTGTELEVSAQLLAINEERERKLGELADKYLKESEKQNQDAFQQRLDDEDAAEVEREAQLQEMFEGLLISEQRRDQLIYESKHASLEAKLALEEAYGGKTSAAYRKTYAELEKTEKDHNKQVLADAKKREDAKRQFTQMGLSVASDALGTTVNLLSQDENARRKNAGVIKAFTIAKIQLDSVQEVQGIWRNYNANPVVNAIFPGAGAVLAGVQTAIAIGRSFAAMTAVGNQQFAAGGATGGGMRVAPSGMLQELSGTMAVGSNGKLIDNTGFAVAGIVHEDEYVIPKWMRQDPKVMQVEQWLENRRLRGYAEGGPTSGGAQGTVADVSAVGADRPDDVQQQTLAALQLLNSRLAGVETWQRELRVMLSLRELDRQQATQKAVALDSKIS